MASSWRDILPKVLAEREGVDVRSVSSVSPVSYLETAPNGPNGTNGELPAEIVAGIGALRTVRCPAHVKRDAWVEVVRDAIALSELWAAQALALGWTWLDLFGAITDPEGDPEADGLAVWLNGRRILLLDERTCIVDAGAGARAVFTRRAPAGAVLLWDIGSGR